MAASAGLTKEPPRILDRLMLAALVVLLVSWFVVYLHSLRGYEFQGDDWRLLVRGGSLRDYFRPYNQHLSITWILVYRILLSTFGLHSTAPWKVAHGLCFVGVIVAVFVFVRSRFGAPVALVVAATILWYPGLQWVPTSFNFWMALGASIVCAWALTDSRPSIDVVVGLTLAFALCSSGVGVASAVGCLVYVTLSKASVRRRALVVAPFAAWIAWWLFVSGNRGRGGNLGLGETVEYAFDGVMGSFRGFVFGNRILGAILAVVFVANLAWHLRRGLRSAVVELSWTAAFVFWWVALAFARGGISRVAAGQVSRYALVGSVFLILASRPIAARSISWPQTSHRNLVVAPVAILVALLPVVANPDDSLEHSRTLASISGLVREQLIAANLGPAAVPDGVELQLGLFTGYPDAKTYRRLAARHGAPGGTRTDRPDAAIVAAGPIRLTLRKSPAGRACNPVAKTLRLEPTSTPILRARHRDVDVELRRFGDTWTRVGRIRAGSIAQLRLPGLGSERPWTVRAPGACVFPGPLSEAECARTTGSPSGETITVPRVVGKNVYAAAAAVKRRGLKVAVVSTRSDDVASGVVFSQVPEAGAAVRAESCVRIGFSRGP